MKIGIFTDSYLPYVSGVVKSIEFFRQEYQKQGHEVYIFAPYYAKCPKEPRIFRYISVPSLANPGYNLAIPFSMRVRPMIKNLNLDIIHVHSPFLLGRVGAKYARKYQIPLVVTFHTLYEEYVHYFPWKQKTTKELTRKICRNFCNSCDLVISPTEIVADYLVKLGVTTPIESIPTGINLTSFQKTNSHWLRSTYQIDPDKKILIFVGRLGQEKNIPFLFNILHKLLPAYPQLCLVVVGNGPEKETFVEQIKQMGLTKQIILTGKLPWEKVVDCYQDSDIFVCSSLTETQGLVVVEAKAAGLPTVAVRSYGVGEMIADQEDGFLTELDEDSFQQKIKLLLDDPQLYQQMSQKAQENSLKFSAEASAKKMLGCYQKLIKKSF